MATKPKVFISWSGELSKQLGQAVGDWIQAALPFIEPFFTPDSVEKGRKWLSEISTELENSDCGIICLTRENLKSPWILFEAGALSKKFRSNVCTLVFDVKKTDVELPLGMFQATDFTKDDFRRLFKTINNVGGDLSLKEPGFTRAFDKWWPDLEKEVNRIRAEYEPAEKGEQRDERDILEEILELTRSNTREREAEITKRVREGYLGQIRDIVHEVRKSNEEFVAELFAKKQETLERGRSNFWPSSLGSASLSFGAPSEPSPPPQGPPGSP